MFSAVLSSRSSSFCIKPACVADTASSCSVCTSTALSRSRTLSSLSLNDFIDWLVFPVLSWLPLSHWPHCLLLWPLGTNDCFFGHWEPMIPRGSWCVLFLFQRWKISELYQKRLHNFHVCCCGERDCNPCSLSLSCVREEGKRSAYAL